MDQEIKSCQNCKKDFVIEPDDFSFYKKINVPAPTWCPECRFIRRLMVRNERTLYRRTCGLCNKTILSMYDPKQPFTVYCKDCWWGDGWDPLAFGQDYDFSKTFFVQFKNLLEKTPRPNLILSDALNCDYCNYFAGGKNCYLCFGSIEVEDCMYGAPYESKNCVDTYLARECEYCYEAIDCEKLSRCSHVQDCANSFDLLYCFDCKNCQDCIGCAGLRNKSYYIFNQPYLKEDYKQKREEIFKAGRLAFNDIEAKFNELKKKIPHRFATTLQCKDVSGDHIVQSKNAKNCFDVKRAEDSSYCIRIIDAKDAYDTNYCEFLELCYEYIGFWKNNGMKFSNTCGEGSNAIYSDFCFGSSDVFGCVALPKKQYCILNKQYAKEEYEKLVSKITEHMDEMPYTDKKGRTYKYGEFFPAELSPFAYNETVAHEFYPLTKEEALTKGYRWRDPEDKDYQITMQNPPDNIAEVDDSILKQIISCAHKGVCKENCTGAFKITQQELQFYRKMQQPIPILCPNCRNYQRLAKRTLFKLWSRTCAKCGKEIQTSYAPDRPEIVYCEQCYQQEVA